MDKIIETKDFSNDMFALWSQAFGDTKEEISFFAENCINKSCVYLEKDSHLASMLFLVDCFIKGVKSKYIFAACTFENMKKHGYMTLLLNYCKEKYGYIALIPADQGLVEYYNKRGFKNKLKIDDILFNESENIKEYLIEGCSLNEPFALSYCKEEL